MRVEPTTTDQRVIRDLQASLDAYRSNELAFDELRTQWIAALSDNPAMCKGAVRLLYQQPMNEHLTDERALSLKRVVESAFQDGPDDSTIVFEEDDSPTAVVIDNGNDTSPAQVKPVPAAIGPGSVLKDRFVLEKLIGRGGIGDVYRAHDRLRHLAHAGPAKIALKILREEFRAKPELLRALQREALQAQTLSHPNIVRVHDIHRESGTCFLTMELLDGTPLRRALSQLKSRPMPRNRAMQIVAGLCRGLAHAHARGVVHADIKPGNIILTAGGEPRILDFGLAQAATSMVESGHSPSKPPGKSLRAVTPAYASCNRLEGGAPSFSDDVYSLACVIYELMSGEHPFGRKSALVARELNLQPKRIAGLTDLQWRCLAAALRPWRQESTTEVYDLQEAFTTRVVKEPQAKPQRLPQSQPPSQATNTRKTGRPRVVAALVIGALLGAALVSAGTMFEVELIPSRYVDRVRDSSAMQSLRAKIDGRTTVVEGADRPPADTVQVNATAPSESVTSPAPAAEVAGTKIEVATSPSSEALPDYDALPSTVANEEAVISAIPDTPGFQLTSSEYLITEGAAALAVEIRRYGDVSTPASVEWTTIAESAQPQLDYVSFERAKVQFAAGEDTKTVFIPIVSDAKPERQENFRVALSRPGNDMVLTEPSTASVTIIDDDI